MILVKTEAGQRVLKDRSVALTPRQRSAFILCDGKRTVDDVLQAGMGVAREDIDRLVELGLLELNGASGPANGSAPVAAAPAPAASSSTLAAPAPAPAPAAATPSTSASPGARTPQQRYKDAYPIATQLTSSLGLRGFRLNLAVEGTTSYEQLLALFPKIQAAVGADKAAALQRALGSD